MARPDGSSASATARQQGFQLPLLLILFHSQSCGHKQLDMLSLLLGRSRPDGQLVKVFLALLVRIVRDDTSQFVVAPADRIISMVARIIGQAAMVRRSRPGHVVDMFAGRTQRHVAIYGTDIGSIVAGRPPHSSGWRIEVTVGPYWLLAPNG